MSRENRRKASVATDPPAVVALERRLKSLLREAVEPAYPVPPYLTPAELYDDWPGTRRAYPQGYPQDRKHGQDAPLIRNEDDLRLARSVSRFLAGTNPLVIGFVGHIGSFVVGSGFKWSVGLKGVAGDDPAEKKDPAVVACQKFLDEFCEINGWGDTGEVSVGDFDSDADDSPPTNLQMEGWESAMEDGELFLRLFLGGAKTNGVPLVRKVNPECVYCPPGETQEGPWSFGIQTDPDDRQTRLAYHIANPDTYPQDGEIVPAKRIVHFKMNAKTDVKRGVPDFWVLEKEAHHLRKLWQNMSEVTAILSAIAYIRQHAPGVSGTQIANMNDRLRSGTDFSSAKWGDSGASDIYRTFTRHESGTIIDVTNGMQFQPPPAVTGLPGFIQGMQATLRIFGLRWGCPEYFSGDSSNANFASTLVAGGPFERATVKRQQDYKRFQGNLATRALLLGVESGRLTRDQVMRVSVKITPPAVAIANKAEDTGRRVQLMQAAGLSKRTVLEEEGYDPDREAANTAKEAAEQQPPQMPGDPGAGATVPQDGPTPDQRGDPLADLFGAPTQAVESVQDPAEPVPPELLAAILQAHARGDADAVAELVELAGDPDLLAAVLDGPPDEDALTEAKRDRSHLVFDKVKKRWVNPDKKAPVRKTPAGQLTPKEMLAARKQAAEPARAAAREAWAGAVADPTKITPDQLAGLAGHLGALTRDELRTVARGLQKKVGGLKRELVDRLLQHVGQPPTGGEKKAGRKPTPAELTADIHTGVDDLLRENPVQGLVSIPDLRASLRDKYGDGFDDKAFDDAILAMRQSKRYGFVASRNENLPGGVSAFGQTLGHIEPPDGYTPPAKQFQPGEVPDAATMRSAIADIADGIAASSANGLAPIHAVRDEVRKRFGDAAASHAYLDPIILAMHNDKGSTHEPIGMAKGDGSTPEQKKGGVMRFGHYLHAISRRDDATPTGTAAKGEEEPKTGGGTPKPDADPVASVKAAFENATKLTDADITQMQANVNALSGKALAAVAKAVFVLSSTQGKSEADRRAAVIKAITDRRGVFFRSDF